MHPGPPPQYGHVQQHNGHNGYYAPQQQPGYAPVYYPVSHGGDVGQHAAYDNRRRGFDALNDFFGDAKRRQIDPTSYHQVGQRLMALQGIPIGGGGMAEYMPTGPTMVAVDGHGGHHLGGHVPPHHYALPPMPNLRTKNDLMNIDQFLEQMQSTVYESSNAAAAAGIQQPGTHYTPIGFRQSHSPPQAPHSLNSHVSAHVAPMVATNSNQSNAGTPALTPPSSSVSYTSGHSPTSSHGMSPTSRHSSTASAPYPSLPAVTMGYSSHSTAAPTSTLGTNFDSDPRRRYSGGMLQRSNPHSADTMELSDDSRSASKETTPRPETILRTTLLSSNIDPALSAVSSPGEHSESGEEKAARENRDREEEAWIENIRVIEALRKLISDRLERREYVEDDDTSMTGTEHRAADVKAEKSESLYPVLRADD